MRKISRARLAVVADKIPPPSNGLKVPSYIRVRGGQKLLTLFCLTLNIVTLQRNHNLSNVPFDRSLAAPLMLVSPTRVLVLVWD